jgi:hypothetical protein
MALDTALSMDPPVSVPSMITYAFRLPLGRREQGRGRNREPEAILPTQP